MAEQVGVNGSLLLELATSLFNLFLILILKVLCGLNGDINNRRGWLIIHTVILGRYNTSMRVLYTRDVVIKLTVLYRCVPNIIHAIYMHTCITPLYIPLCMATYI